MYSLILFVLSVQTSEDMQIKQEVSLLEEERIQVLNNIEELEQKIKDLDTQLNESVGEVCVRSLIILDAVNSRIIKWTEMIMNTYNNIVDIKYPHPC